MLGTTGTFEAVIGKIFDLYMGSHVKDVFVRKYLSDLRDEKIEHVFTIEDVDKLLKILQRDRRELNMVTYSKEKHYCIACGRGRYVNTSGFCSSCWGTFSHLREARKVE